VQSDQIDINRFHFQLKFRVITLDAPLPLKIGTYLRHLNHIREVMPGNVPRELYLDVMFDLVQLEVLGFQTAR